MANLKELFKTYIAKRREANAVDKLGMSGVMLQQHVDSLIKARIFKPSQYEVEEMIQKCKKRRELLLELAKGIKEEKDNEINDTEKERLSTLLEELNTLSINTLSDCKVLAKCYIKAASVLDLSTRFIYRPIAVGISLPEYAVAFGIAYSVFEVARVF